MDSNNLKVSIIIINFNGIKYLGPCISSIYESNYPKSSYEIIVVDNASEDRSIDFLTKNYPDVILVKLKQNLGYTGGNNEGVKHAKYDYYIFLNNDTIVDKNWLSELTTAIQIDNRIGLCASHIVSMDKKTSQYDGYLLHTLGGVIPGHRVGKLSNINVNFIGSVQGASFIIRKSVFHELNGFDGTYFMYSDEVDLSYRAWISGYDIIYAPKSIVYHKGGGSSKNTSQSNMFKKRLNSSLRVYYGNRNSLINIIKTYEIKDIIIGLLFSFPIFALQAFFLIKSREFRLLISLFKAMIWPLIYIKIILINRKIVQKKRKRSDSELDRLHIFLRIPELIKRAI